MPTGVSLVWQPLCRCGLSPCRLRVTVMSSLTELASSPPVTVKACADTHFVVAAVRPEGLMPQASNVSDGVIDALAVGLVSRTTVQVMVVP